MLLLGSNVRRMDGKERSVLEWEKERRGKGLTVGRKMRKQIVSERERIKLLVSSIKKREH